MLEQNEINNLEPNLENLGKHADVFENENILKIKQTEEEIEKNIQKLENICNNVSPYLGGTTIDVLLNTYGYDAEKSKKFKIGLYAVYTKAIASFTEAEANLILKNKKSMITFFSSVIKIAKLYRFPDIENYYIAPRKINDKLSNASYYTFKIEMQYQAEMQTLMENGVEIIRVDYIHKEECVDGIFEINHFTGEMIIKHTPNLLIRKAFAEKNASLKGKQPIEHIIGAYVVYKEKYQDQKSIKYYFIEYEQILKAFNKGNAISWGGTAGYGVKKTAIHRFFEYKVNNNLGAESEMDEELFKINFEPTKQKTKHNSIDILEQEAENIEIEKLNNNQ